MFVSHHEKLEKTFEVFSQVLDNFVAKVCRTSFLIHFFCDLILPSILKRMHFSKYCCYRFFSAVFYV